MARLDGNRFTGPLPAALGSLGNALKGLYVSDNLFESQVPLTWVGLGGLRVLSAHSCGFSGNAGQLLDALPTSVRQVVLDNNHLTGSLPTSVSRLRAMRRLVLSDNLLEGPLPTELADLSYLKGLEVDGNHLTGAVPEQLGALPLTTCVLTRLENATNEFASPVPPTVVNRCQIVMAEDGGVEAPDPPPSPPPSSTPGLQRR